MNRVLKFASCFIAILLTLAVAIPVRAQVNPKNTQGEEFFIISSVDLQKHQVVLMRPTQLTVVAAIDTKTIYIGEKGQKLNIKSMKAGDTVWAITKTGADGKPVAVKIREGAMTPAELHKLYLHLPPSDFSTSPLPQSPMTPRPQRST